MIRAVDAAPDLFSFKALSYPDDIPEDICALFERLALEVHAQGFKRYSARALLHQIRWHFQVEKGNRQFKINNNCSAELARWFLAHHPELPKFFELRDHDE